MGGIVEHGGCIFPERCPQGCGGESPPSHRRGPYFSVRQHKSGRSGLRPRVWREYWNSCRTRGDSAGVWYIVPFSAINGVVGAVMEIGCVGVQLQCFLLGGYRCGFDRRWSRRRRTGRTFEPLHRPLWKNCRLERNLPGPFGPSGSWAPWQTECWRRPAKENFIVVGYLQECPQTGFGILKD